MRMCPFIVVCMWAQVEAAIEDEARLFRSRRESVAFMQADMQLAAQDENSTDLELLQDTADVWFVVYMCSLFAKSVYRVDARGVRFQSQKEHCWFYRLSSI
jgi:hypothetical protein